VGLGSNEVNAVFVDLNLCIRNTAKKKLNSWRLLPSINSGGVKGYINVALKHECNKLDGYSKL